MSETQTKQVAVKKQALPPANLLNTFVEDSGAGQENVTQDDMQIPFIRIIQATSPQVKKKDSKYIAGAEISDIFNTVTNQLWKSEDGIKVIPCGYVKKFLEFGVYEEGGGFKGEISPNDPVLNQLTREGNKDKLPNGNEMVTSAQHYVKVQDPSTGSWQTAILDMKSTSLKVSRQWNTQIAMQEVTVEGKVYKTPSFGVIWHLGVDDFSNDMGSWSGWKILGKQGFVDDADLYASCREFSQMVVAGEVKEAEDPDLAEKKPQQDDGNIPC